MQSKEKATGGGGRSTCLHELFEEQARETPRLPAVVDAHGTLTYEELDHKADLLAGYLRGAGVGPDEVVGVFMERRAEYVVACLAAMKAGGAFLPLELAYPEGLLADVVADAGPRVILTQEHLADRLPEQQAKCCLDDGWEEKIGGGVPEDDGPRPGLDNLVFVAYSSGTTGKPKGIANPHRAAVLSYLWRFENVHDQKPGDRVACGVFFIWEVFRPLLRGAASYVIPNDVVYDPAALIGYLEEHRISETLMTPSLLGTVLNASGPDVGERLKGLHTLWLNGEVVSKDLARRALEALPNTRLLNVYSASETHEVAAGGLQDLVEKEQATHCPVGRPMDPDRLYVLDAEMRPVPEDSAGELFVGGSCLARGYLNKPELTDRRFTRDPFVDESGARMYRTGDKARLLPDGSLEVLGRVDFMAKIRGYSVELGAVEAAIERHVAVRGCVVVAEGEEGEDKRLVAYLVPGPDAAGDGRLAPRVDPRTGRSPEIRRRLQESLPQYAIPAVYVEVEALPMQATTGKVDRRRLPAPPARVADGPEEFALPENASRQEEEALLARIWEHVLGLEGGDVRHDDDFFDTGGHSLAAAQLLSHVEDAFGARFSMRTFLENPTVAGLRDAIEARRSGGEDGRGARQRTGPEALRARALLDQDIVPEGRGADIGEAPPLRDARRVFLTGATGFLGAFLLDELLARAEAEVHCLVRAREGDAEPAAPIRAALERYGLWRPELAERFARRVVPVVGDLTKPLLGVPEDHFGDLGREIDLIFHAGAVVNMIYPYSALESANVLGTREVLRLACTNKPKPVHHVSTNGIFPPGRGPCEEDADLDALAGTVRYGYGQSKWAAEKLVRQAAERGLPVSVYRPGNISGHSVSGASNPRDFLGALVVESLRLGYAPRIQGWRMEMTPVDAVSRAICRLADEPGFSGRTFHLTDPDPVPAETVFSWLEAMGYPLERLDYPAWLDALHRAPRPAGNGVVGSILRGSAPDERELWDGNVYDDANTRRALGESWRPAIDAPLFGAYIRYFVNRGWVDAAPGLPRDVRVGAQHS